ncbi:hypothetical protein [Streptomyces sp. NPDC086023]|uniref:hypothetical protein n=1 Tax=Streptomyces sp. NPDC086023 TaxID=3365746 RepID=UPI0037D479EE
MPIEPQSMPVTLDYTSTEWQAVYIDELPENPTKLTGLTREHFRSYCRHFGLKGITSSSSFDSISSHFKKNSYSIENAYRNYRSNFSTQQLLFKSNNAALFNRLTDRRIKSATARATAERIKQAARLGADVEYWCSRPSNYVIDNETKWNEALRKYRDSLKDIPVDQQERSGLTRILNNISIKEARVKQVKLERQLSTKQELARLEKALIGLSAEPLRLSRVAIWTDILNKYHQARDVNRNVPLNAETEKAIAKQKSRLTGFRIATDAKNEFRRREQDPPSVEDLEYLKKRRFSFELAGKAAGLPEELRYSATVSHMDQTIKTWSASLAEPHARQRRPRFEPIRWQYVIDSDFPVKAACPANDLHLSPPREWDLGTAKAFYAFCHLNRYFQNMSADYIGNLDSYPSDQIVHMALRDFGVVVFQDACSAFEKAWEARPWRT